MRLALFGGTFDPIHRGHLAIASAAAREFALDRVLFLPTGRQPLKSEAPVATYEQRLWMAQLAVDGLNGDSKPAGCGFRASGLDAPRPDGQPNYTVDLLARVRELCTADWLVALAGADSFLTLRQWHEPDRLLALSEWIVVSRPGSSLTEEQLAAVGLTPEQRERVHLLTTVHEDVSATELRQRLAAGDPCRDLLPPKVGDYIEREGLYR